MCGWRFAGHIPHCSMSRLVGAWLKQRSAPTLVPLWHHMLCVITSFPVFGRHWCSFPFLSPLCSLRKLGAVQRWHPDATRHVHMPNTICSVETPVDKVEKSCPVDKTQGNLILHLVQLFCQSLCCNLHFSPQNVLPASVTMMSLSLRCSVWLWPLAM